MKEILKILKQLNERDEQIYAIQLCSDWSGILIDSDDNYVFAFYSKKDLIERLKKQLNK